MKSPIVRVDSKHIIIKFMMHSLMGLPWGKGQVSAFGMHIYSQFQVSDPLFYNAT